MVVADPIKTPDVGQEPLTPTTTGEQNLQSAGTREAKALESKGQRRVNLIWETTQAGIAILVVMAAISSGFIPTSNETLLANAFFLVIGFYFGRTNHTKVGGVSEARRGE